jgi:hypothetical protein
MPSLDDFEAQLERSLEVLEEGKPNVLFDRCPADILAYLLAHEDAESFEVEDWSDRIRDAMKSLDLVVFVPIEDDDRIALPSHEDAELRAAVDEKLREILVDDALGFGCEVLVVEGDIDARVGQVTKRIRAARKRDTFGS